MDIQKAEDYVLDKLDENLSDSLYYHGVHHTIDVTNAALQLAVAEGIDDKETARIYLWCMYLVQITTGFMFGNYILERRGKERRNCRQKFIQAHDPPLLC